MKANMRAVVVLALIATALNACELPGRWRGGDRGGVYRCIGRC
jgi:hypothetical protein